MQAKLMWNPDCDVERHMREFLAGYYGEPAAPYVRAYIDLWQKAAERWHVGINERVMAPYITDELLNASQELLSKALFETEEPVMRKRLQKLNLGIEYILLQRMPQDTPGRNALITRFGWECRECGIDELHERWPLDTALEAMRRDSDESSRKRTLTNDFKM